MRSSARSTRRETTARQGAPAHCNHPKERQFAWNGFRRAPLFVSKGGAAATLHCCGASASSTSDAPAARGRR
eukprot:9145376-Pyramimonas_sp.AAC.1